MSGRRRGEQSVVPAASFTSYYGRPVLKAPVWRSPDVPAYLFLGGVAGASSVLAAGARATGQAGLETRSTLTAAGAAGLSLVALVHDLGRPARFLNMLRVFKPTSPMSVGSWILAPYSGAAAVGAACALSRRAPRVATAAGAAGAALGPLLATYTGALLADTAIPAWHGGHRHLPFVFGASAAAAAGGVALALAPPAEAAPARRLAVAGGLAEVALVEAMVGSLGRVGDPYRDGRAGRWLRAGKVLGGVGVATAWAGRRNRPPSVAAGLTLAAASLCTRFGVFEAGRQSAADPRYVVVPQREALAARA